MEMGEWYNFMTDVSTVGIWSLRTACDAPWNRIHLDWGYTVPTTNLNSFIASHSRMTGKMTKISVRMTIHTKSHFEEYCLNVDCFQAVNKRCRTKNQQHYFAVFRSDSVAHLTIFVAVPVECSSALGLQDGSLPKSSLTASSAECGTAADARLNSSVGWAAYYWKSQWLQVELGHVTNVTAIATQGHPGFDWWTRRYLVYSSFDGKSWQPYHKVRGEFHSSSPALLGFLWSPDHWYKCAQCFPSDRHKE